MQEISHFKGSFLDLDFRAKSQIFARKSVKNRPFSKTAFPLEILASKISVFSNLYGNFLKPIFRGERQFSKKADF